MAITSATVTKNITTAARAMVKGVRRRWSTTSFNTAENLQFGNECSSISIRTANPELHKPKSKSNEKQNYCKLSRQFDRH
jgi:hypothetical protein